MYGMVSDMWVKGTITAEQIAALVARGRLTQGQADAIMAEPQV